MRRSISLRIDPVVRTVFCAMVALGCFASCRRGTPTPVRVPTLAEGYDTGPIDVHNLSSDALLRRRVLGMSWREVRGRLGALRFADKGIITWMGPNDTVHEQSHQATIEYDAIGGLHLIKQTPPHVFELLVQEDKCFVRQDLGKLRRKTPREMDLEDLQEAAWASLRGMLSQFRGVTLADPQSEVFAGREVVRYRVALEETPSAPSPMTEQQLPVAPLLAWRDELTKSSLDGTVRIDVDSGVVLEAKLTGELQFVAKEDAPSGVKLRYTNRIDQIGRVAAIAEPQNTIAEHLRPIRPRDPLAFFHHAGQSQKHVGKAQTSESPADASPDALEGQSEQDELPGPRDSETPAAADAAPSP